MKVSRRRGRFWGQNFLTREIFLFKVKRISISLVTSLKLVLLGYLISYVILLRLTYSNFLLEFKAAVCRPAPLL